LTAGEMATPTRLSVDDVLRVNGSRRFAAAMAAASPFASLADALLAARRIWLNEVGRLLAFALASIPSLLGILFHHSTSCTDDACCSCARSVHR
jgi:hypothetical protein